MIWYMHVSLIYSQPSGFGRSYTTATYQVNHLYIIHDTSISHTCNKTLSTVLQRLQGTDTGVAENETNYTTEINKV